MSERLKAVMFGVSLGVSVFATEVLVSEELFPDTGRGQEITACPTDYDGLIQVTDTDALETLGQVAKDRDIRDSAAEKSSDIATLPGELACKDLIDFGTDETVIVLLPAGVEALDRGGSYALVPGQSQLPDGLSW